jgi:hypothetical protein
MKNFKIVLACWVATVFQLGAVYASDYGDTSCQIFVAQASNEITGCCGNFINAEVWVSKSLIARDFKDFQVKIQHFESAEPTRVVDQGDYIAFEFSRYREGVYYRTHTADIQAYITNGVDRLFDNNDNVVLTREFAWRYTNPRCHK